MRPISKKRQRLNKLYLKARAEYLAEHPYCQWFMSFHGLDEAEVLANNGWFTPKGPCETELNYRGMAQVPQATEIHHKRGRVGDLLCNKEFFFAVSSEGHRYIHENTRESYGRGWMLPR